MRLRFANFTLNTDSQELEGENGVLPMEPQVFKLLLYLIENKDKVVGKEELFSELWAGKVVSDATLTSRINLLRNTLGDSGQRQDFIKTYPKRGYRFVAELIEEPTEPLSGAQSLSAPASTTDQQAPSVAVLPFNDLDTANDFFAEGVTEEVTVALSRSSELAVIALRSAMALQQDTPLLSDAGKRLQARYIVNGSVRRSGNQVRVTAALTDTDIGSNLWAERFDGATTDIFEIQDKVAQGIAAALPGRIQDNESRRHGDRRSPSTAYDLYLRAIWGLRRDGDVLKAIEALQAVLAEDESFGLAHSRLATLLGFSVFITGQDDASVTRDSLAHAHRALALDPADERIHAAAAMAFLDAGEFALAQHHSEKALALNPHSIESMHFRGCVTGSTGDPESALRWQHEVMRLDPLHPTHYFENVIEAHYLLGQYDQAIAICENWDKPHDHVKATLGACYAMGGDNERGRQLAQEFSDSRPPDFRISDYVQATLRYHAREADKQHWREGFQASRLIN